MNTTKLFTIDNVNKFFNILDSLSGSTPVDKDSYRYKDYQTIYTKESKHVPCTREVFVHRTINKWFKGKYLIIYKQSDLGVSYKQYVSISCLSYHNDWSGSGYISVSLFDYAKPFDSILFHGEKIKHNNAISIEGQWCENGDVHNQLLSFITMNDVPNKEYVFQAYDWDKYPKRKKKGVDPMDLVKTTKSFIAKTEHHAYEMKKNYEKNSNDEQKLSIGELIEIR